MNVKYYKIADITVEVRSDLSITEKTFHPRLKEFEIEGQKDDMVMIHHHFEGLPDIEVEEQNCIYFKPPWAIYRKDANLIYEWIEPTAPFRNYDKKVVANNDH